MKLTKAQLVGVATFLSEWDNTLTYEQILEETRNNEMVSVWEPFEESDPDEVVNHIENLRMFCEAVYGKEES